MKIEYQIKYSFSVIGKEGSTLNGSGFIKKLWNDADFHFSEIEKLVKRDEHGNIIGVWGTMSDLNRQFKPWEDNFSKWLYLAGFECNEDALAPDGWKKWTIPSYEYLCVEVENENTFIDMINYLKENNITLVGAVHDYTCPRTFKNYMYFPIKLI